MNTKACRLALILIAGGFSTGGCCAAVAETAMVGGVQMTRPNLRFTGQPYTIEHFRAHPVPGGPSQGLVADGGWIGGEVCRRDVLYYVEHHGEHVLLEGYVNGRGGSWLVVRDVGGRRSITGPGSTLWLTANSLSGTIANRALELSRRDGHLVGRLGEKRVVMNNVDALWDMPAADQAALIHQLLTCPSSAMPGRVLRRAAVGAATPVEVGFGGEPVSLPLED